MGREIKFRAWFELENKMVLSENLMLSYDGEDCFDFAFDKETIVDDEGSTKGTLCFKLMQFTGLKDKNGKDIYEGDILKVTHEDGDSENYHVEYLGHQNYPAFDLVPFLDCDCNGLSHVMAVCKVEVIGNKYENPELLEVKEE